MEDRQISS